MLNLSHPSPQQTSVEKTPQSMLLTRLLLWGSGIWIVIMMAIAVVAMKGLFYTGSLEPQKSASTTAPSPASFETIDSATELETVIEPNVEPQSDILRSPPSETASPPSPSEQPNLPLWVFGAIAVACASGSLGVTFLLKQLSTKSAPVKVSTPMDKPTKPRKSKPPAKKSKKRVVRKPQPQATPPKKVRRPAATRPPVQPPPQPQPQPKPPSPAIFEPLVTVVPAETQTPVDRHQPDLAEMMDLRKRRSLAALMQNLDD